MTNGLIVVAWGWQKGKNQQAKTGLNVFSLRMALRQSQGNGVRTMKNLTPLEHLFLQLFAKLDDQKRHDVLRIMEALVQSSK
jgi:hypothetical protein